jgi:hypothetical protein
MSSAHIDDKYTRVDVFPETKLHPAVRVTYRPVTARERRLMIARNGVYSQEGEAGAEKVIDGTIAIIVEHLRDWSVTSADGKALPINAETYGALEPNLFEDIQKAVLGFNDAAFDKTAVAREAEAAKNFAGASGSPSSTP